MVVITLTTFSAAAQQVSQQMVGKWKATGTGPCGETNIEITKIETNGVVRGTLDCVLRRLTIVLGEKRELDRAMEAKLSGKYLSIQGANSSIEVAYENGQLVGFATGGQGKRTITFTKQ
jgi:hypothetical protein